MRDYVVRARNTAPDSENRMHDDQTAAQYGFRGGLVPGITVYGYLTVPVVERFGVDWLERGGIQVRFRQPVYDGEEIIVTSTDNRVSASRRDGTECAAGEVVWPRTEAPPLAGYPEEPLPAERPLASEASLAPGRILGTVHADLSGEAPPIYHEGILQPAALLSLSNQVLMQNVKLGPWIHLASELRHFSLARDGEQLAARGRVAERYAHKGHQFVVLDILVVAGGARLVQHVRHTAIYEPRLV